MLNKSHLFIIYLLVKLNHLGIKVTLDWSIKSYLSRRLPIGGDTLQLNLPVFGRQQGVSLHYSRQIRGHQNC